MLASTVKFSRCGRQTSRRFDAPVSDPLEDQLHKRPNPQDPTACLGFVGRPVEVPLLKTGSTDDESAKEAYWSMFHIPVPARFQSMSWKTSGWTDLSICQMAP
jgi:hypothetical protein